VDTPHRDIQFTTTEDGFGIAYWEIGSGLPLIVTHNWSLCHAELEWKVPSIASFLVALSERYRVIRFDPRGKGLSDTMFVQRGVSSSGALLGLSTEESGLDISAVAEACGLERFALMAVMTPGPVAIDFAARHPEKLTALILCDSLAKVESSFLDVAIQTQAAMHELETDAGASFPITVFATLAPPDELPEWAVVTQASHAKEGETYVPATIALREWDATPLLGAVKAPTLILTSRNPSFDFLGESRKLAAGIPNSQLRIVDGTFAPYVADRTAVLDAIDNLLGGKTEPDDSADLSGFRTIVFTDIVGSTEFVRRVGDEEGRAAVRELERQVASVAADHGGRVVKNLGDGSLVSFGSNSSAISFGLAVQDKSQSGPLRLRVGMAAGEPIQEDGDVHGTVVAQASRIGDLGDAGEIIVSDSVRQLAAGKGFTFEPKGEVLLKGFDEPERVWKVTQTSRP
jgi:class 3 adenylate cyclase